MPCGISVVLSHERTFQPCTAVGSARATMGYSVVTQSGVSSCSEIGVNGSICEFHRGVSTSMLGSSAYASHVRRLESGVDSCSEMGVNDSSCRQTRVQIETGSDRVQGFLPM